MAFFHGFREVDMGVSINGWYPKMVGLFHGESHLEMDDDWGHPHFRKPPYGFLQLSIS